MLAPVTHILPLTTIRRERILPVPGKVIVRKGTKVTANEVVAEASLTPEHLILDVARGLGLPAAKADERVQCKAGDLIAEGDVVAGPVGLTRRVVRSPRDGRVILTGNGQVLLEVKGQPYELKAGVPGEVVELIPDRGVIVETTGALIQGAWGNGRIDFGLLTPLATTPDHVLDGSQLDVSMRGAMILAGHCEQLEALRAAVEIPVRGLILSSMAPELVDFARKMSIPVLLIEGFGRRPMNAAAFKLLATSERREIVVNAEGWDAYTGTRPELVIPLPASGPLALPKEAEDFAPGQQVRSVKAPAVGMIGTLVDLRGSMVFPSGVRALAGEVRLENGETVLLPLANLEVLA